MPQQIASARARGALAMGLALAVGAGFIGCSGGGGVGIGIATLGISGIVESTGGSLAKGDAPRKSFLDRLLGVEVADAAVTGLAPVNGRLVRLVQLDPTGSATAVLFETTTAADGSFSFAGVPASATNVACIAFDATLVPRLRGFVGPQGVSVNVDPISEFVVRACTATGNIEGFTQAERAVLDATARQQDLALSGNIESAVGQTSAALGTTFTALVNALAAPGSNASAASGTYGYTYLGVELGTGTIRSDAGGGDLTLDGAGSASFPATSNGGLAWEIHTGFTLRTDTTLVEPAHADAYAVESDGAFRFGGSRGAVVTGGAYVVFTGSDDSPQNVFRNLAFFVRRAASLSPSSIATGPYHFVTFGNAVLGPTGTASQFDSVLRTATATFLSNGQVTLDKGPELFPRLDLPNGPVSFPASSPSTKSGTFTVTSDGQFTLTESGQSAASTGFVTGDARLILVRSGEIQSGESGNGIALFLRKATSAPAIDGNFHAMSLLVDLRDTGPAQVRSEHTFGSATISGGTVSLNVDASQTTVTPSTFAPLTRADSITFTATVATDGTVTTTGLSGFPVPGFASADGRLLVLPFADDNVGSQKGERGLLVLVRKW